MAKNIVLCCDGTANQFARDNTNVVKLFSVLIHNDARQRTYYQPGIGTMEPPGALTPVSRRITRGLSMAFGAYLEQDIRNACAFLMQEHEPGDRVFLFGFSRGAYTVRSLAALLRMYGLLWRGNEPMIPYAIRMMMAITEARKAEKDRQRYARTIRDYFELAAAFKTAMARECKPHFVGVWDTVSSVGWIANPLKLPYVADNGDIAVGRHAVALDERRAFFRHQPVAAGAGPQRDPRPRRSQAGLVPGRPLRRRRRLCRGRKRLVEARARMDARRGGGARPARGPGQTARDARWRRAHRGARPQGPAPRVVTGPWNLAEYGAQNATTTSRPARRNGARTATGAVPCRRTR